MRKIKFTIYSLLDPRFKDICFSSSALVRAKRLLLSIMCAKSINPVSSSASVVIDAEDDQEDAPVKKKKYLWDRLMKNLKRRNLLNYQPVKIKVNKNCHHTAVLNTLIERRILWHGGKETRIATLS